MGARSRPVPRVVEAAGRGHLQRPAANGGLREDLTIDEPTGTRMHNDPLMCRRLIQRDRATARQKKWLYARYPCNSAARRPTSRRRGHTRPTPTHEPCAPSPAGDTGWPQVRPRQNLVQPWPRRPPRRLITPWTPRQRLQTRRARSRIRSRKSQQAAIVIDGTTGWAVVQLQSAVAGPRMLVMPRAALLPQAAAATQQAACVPAAELGIS